jgi:hypothetical protein
MAAVPLGGPVRYASYAVGLGFDVVSHRFFAWSNPVAFGLTVIVGPSRALGAVSHIAATARWP